MKIALIKTGALGDVVRTTSLVAPLRRQAARSDIVWITSAAARPLVSGLDGVRSVVVHDALDADWRRDRYDWIINLDDDVASCETASALDGARLSGAYVDTTGGRAYTDDVAPWFGMGMLRPPELGGLAAANDLKRANTRTYGDLLYDALGLPPPVARPMVAIPPEAHAAASEWLGVRGISPSDGRTFTPPAPIGLNTGAAGRWQFKSWGVEASGALARRFADAGFTVLVLGGAAEAARNRAICDCAAHERVVAGPADFGVLAFAALVARCAAVICSDSLAMHLAIAAGVPVVALFGPTSDAEIDVFGRGEKIVAPVPCVRCYLSTCDVTPNCMQTISPEMVFARAAPIVAARRGSIASAA
jgi:heptosyltransferase-2